MSDKPSYDQKHRRDFDDVLDAMLRADIKDLEFFSAVIDDFPHGKDNHVGSFWMTHAIIECAPIATITWMIRKGITLRYRDDDGDCPLHSCLERDKDDVLEVMAILINAGADVNAHGCQDWTPLHLAAIRDNVPAVRLLLTSGADPRIRTRIDKTETAEEEARSYGKLGPAELIADYIKTGRIPS
ncbi:MAG: ankyrin repeat domain-containing protein [Pelagimonas sp.]|uniref:ankyrin repeat domain-containing protein n=1 Tax=Pelagimonas sp. TaxID=2073170 RepID=UPI003D6A8066